MGIGMPKYARQTRHRAADRHIAVGAPDNVLCLLAEPALLRPAVCFIPDSGAPPDPPCPLEGVGSCGKLPPVNEHTHRRAGFANLSRLIQPLRCPTGPGALVLGISLKRRGRILAQPGIFLGGRLVFLRLGAATGGIRRICDDCIEGAGVKTAQHLQRVTLNDLPFLIIAHVWTSPFSCFYLHCYQVVLSLHTHQ